MTDYELQKWEKEHVEVVTELLNLFDELIGQGYAKTAIIGSILQMRKSFVGITRPMLLRLLHWHGLIYPDVWVRLTKEQIEMVRLLHVDPRDLVRDLVEWYRKEVFEPQRASDGGDSGMSGLGQLFLNDFRKYKTDKDKPHARMQGVGLSEEDKRMMAEPKPKRGRGRPKKMRGVFG